jgi:hypothetical protein
MEELSEKINGCKVLEMLLPDGGWIIVGDDYDSIIWVDDRPRCSKAEFEAGFAQYQTMRTQQKLEAEAKRQALLNKLGITEEEAKLLLS